MYNPLLVKQASPAEDEQAQLEALERWRRPGKQPEISPDVQANLEKLKEMRSRAGKMPEQYALSYTTPQTAPQRGLQPSLAVMPPDYTAASGEVHRLGQVLGMQPTTSAQESKPAGQQPAQQPQQQPAQQQPAQQPQQQSNDPEWSGMYGKDAWRDYQMHKKYMNDPEYKAYTEWYNQNKGRYGTPQQPQQPVPQQQPAQQPQQPAGGIQPGPGWPTGPLGTDGWRLPFRNRPNPDFNPASTGIWPHKGNMPYITPEGELTDSPYGSPFKKPRSGVMGGVFGGSGPGMSWEDKRRALMM